MAASAAWLPATLGASAAPAPDSLIAAWQDEQEPFVGLLSYEPGPWAVRQSLAVPTRAHGLWAQADGSVLAVARRPGEWLLRWQPHTGHTQWHWIDGDRRFNGHVIANGQGSTLWTTETDLDSAQGLLGMRDARTLEKIDEWPTHGMDPHQLLALPARVGSLPVGTLMVANGGIPTLPETGRSKRHIGCMDASLVALHPASGERLGQWRLDDPYLSIRHLVWDAASSTLGIALQAEHTDPASRLNAPVLAVWNGSTLRPAGGQPALAGYGGDICSWPSTTGGFAVSCPKADRMAVFNAQGEWQHSIHHTEAYALMSTPGRWWLASSRGDVGLLRGTIGTDEADTQWGATTTPRQKISIDNHWLIVLDHRV